MGHGYVNIIGGWGGKLNHFWCRYFHHYPSVYKKTLFSEKITFYFLQDKFVVFTREILLLKSL